MRASGDGEEPPRKTHREAVLPVAAAEHQLRAEDRQRRAEYVDRPVEPREDDPAGDHQARAHEQRAEHPPEEDAMLPLAR